MNEGSWWLKSDEWRLVSGMITQQSMIRDCPWLHCIRGLVIETQCLLCQETVWLPFHIIKYNSPQDSLLSIRTIVLYMEGEECTTDLQSQTLTRTVPQNANMVPQNASRVPQNANRVPQNANRVPQNANRVPQNASRVAAPNLHWFYYYVMFYRMELLT